MANDQRWAGTALLVAALAACGGGQRRPEPVPDPPLGLPEPGAPAFTGDTALDAFAWLNFRRSQMGLQVLGRNPQIDSAAQGHAQYLWLNNVVSHSQTAGLPGFTGQQLLNRLTLAGYTLVAPYAYGEVNSATSNSSGFYQVEESIKAIYQRFVLFEPVFKEAGTGSATSGNYTYLVLDSAASNGYGPGLGRGQIVTYPVNQQTGVPINFLSDSCSPDPVPNQNEVGYPISVHANIQATVAVMSFSVAPRGGAAVSARLLSRANDSETPASGAALIPLSVLKAATTYDVSFSGTIEGVPVTRNWSFTTK